MSGNALANSLASIDDLALNCPRSCTGHFAVFKGCVTVGFEPSSQLYCSKWHCSVQRRLVADPMIVNVKSMPSHESFFLELQCHHAHSSSRLFMTSSEVSQLWVVFHHITVDLKCCATPMCQCCVYLGCPASLHGFSVSSTAGGCCWWAAPVHAHMTGLDFPCCCHPPSPLRPNPPGIRRCSSCF